MKLHLTVCLGIILQHFKHIDVWFYNLRLFTVVVKFKNKTPSLGQVACMYQYV